MAYISCEEKEIAQMGMMEMLAEYVDVWIGSYAPLDL